MTHRLMIIHHHTKSGCKKWLSGSGDIERTRSDTRTELQMDRQPDGRTDRQSDFNISPHIYTGDGGGGIKKTVTANAHNVKK